jgi:hypothetical protein
MALVFTEQYQLGNGDSLCFERDLTTLTLFLDRLYPEFKGAMLNEHPDGELWWLIRASCRGKKGDLSSPRIKFELVENTWADGLVRAMQEMHTCLCGLHVEEIKGKRFRNFARRDTDGRPANMPGQNEPSTYIDHMDFLLYSTQQEADRARTKANLEHFALVEARSTIRILARDHKSLRRQRNERDQIIEELKANVAKLIEYIESLESHLGEEEGIDLRKKDNALISDEDDFMEYLDDSEHDEDARFIVDDEEEDPEEPGV